MNQHTPTPWHYQEHMPENKIRMMAQIGGSDGIQVAYTTPENAALIVRAVNEYEELNEIKKLLLKAKERFDQGLPLEYSELIQKAITKAEDQK